MSRSFPAFAVTVLGCAVLLALPAIANGAAFVYIDTATYLAQGQEALRRALPALARALDPALAPGGGLDGGGRLPPALAFERAAGTHGEAPAVMSGRSIYYGIVAYVATVTTAAWSVVAAQALAVALPLVVLARALVPAAWPAAAAGLAAALAFATPAGFFAGLLMPDVWAGAMVLALAALAAAPRAGTARRVALGGIVVAAALFHASHLAVLAALLLLWPAVWAWSRGAAARLAPAAVVAVVAVAAGLAGGAVFSAVVERTFGAPPVARPHVTAHLVDLGPGTAYARAACAQGAPYAICAYVDRLPAGWIEFLFDADPAIGVFETVPPSVQRRLAAEQWRFAWGTLRHDPGGTAGGLALDGLRQLWRLSFADVPRGPHRGDDLADFPPALAAATEASVIASRPEGPAALDVLIALTQATTALAAAAVAALALAPRGRRALAADPALAGAVALLVAGFVVNALVCGVLASPYGRFQARVAWLLPLAAAAWALRAGRADLISARNSDRKGYAR